MPRAITITFDDGTTHSYQNVPDSVTPDQVEQRASSEFSGKKVTNIDGDKGVPRETAGFGSRVHDTESGILSGFAGLVGLPADTALNVYDLAKAGIGTAQGAITGKTPSAIFDPTNRANIPLTAEWNRNQLDKLPITETTVQHPEDAASRYLNAAAQTVPFVAAGASASSLPNIARAGIAALTGSAATQLAKDNGVGPIGQTLAGLAGGLAPTGLESVANLLGKTVSNVIKPITKAGQQEIAANVLQDQASDPIKALQNLQNSQEIISGSPRTTGPASKDAGLLGLEKGMRNKNMSAFSNIVSEQNTVQQDAISNLVGNPQIIKDLKRVRDAQTDPMREAAFSNSVATDSTPIIAKIDEIMASPAGKRETISKTMEWAKNLIGSETDPASLYEIRKDLQLAQRGKLQPSSPNAPAASILALAKGQLGDVINSLDSTIENAAPGFKAYLERYKQLSVPIDQAKVLQEIQRRAQTQNYDNFSQQSFISAAQFGKAVDSAKAGTLFKNQPSLTTDQFEQLRAIRADIRDGQAINSRLIKPAGSDTFQNLSIAQAIGGGIAAQHPMMKIISSPLSWLYKAGGTDPAVNEILTNAMLDPKLAASLLTKATPKSVQTFSQSLKIKAMSGVLGTAAQLSATQSKWQEDKSTQQEDQQSVRQ